MTAQDLSIPNPANDSLFWQRFLATQGFYQGELDNQWGPKSKDAWSDFIEAGWQLGSEFPALSARSDSKIFTLDLRTQRLCRELLQKVQAHINDLIPPKDPLVTFEVLSGTRTFAAQDELYNAHVHITKARGGQSNHNFGCAFDLGVFESGIYLDETHWYKAIAAIAKPLGLEWGGDWPTFRDVAHFQSIPEAKMKDYYFAFISGKPFNHDIFDTKVS